MGQFRQQSGMGTAGQPPEGTGKPDRSSLYQEVTDRIIAELERGKVPWVQPWGGAKTGLGLPQNAATGRCYSGVNILILWGAVIEHGFATQHWLTFRQAVALGGNVRKGERGTMVCYADRFTPKSEVERAAQEGGEPGTVPFLKRFTVFNVAQCDGLAEQFGNAPEPMPEREIIPHAEALIAATGADFRMGGNRAFYVPTGDYIQVPPQPVFFEQINFYRTCFHELSHNAVTLIMPRGRRKRPDLVPLARDGRHNSTRCGQSWAGGGGSGRVGRDLYGMYIVTSCNG